MNLVRRLKTADETLGILTVGGKTFHIIEQPDNHDMPDHSCIPLGAYTLVPHISGRLHEMDGVTPLRTWALVNPGLGVTHSPNDPVRGGIGYPHRSECLIHPANYASQLEGCLAPGDGVSKLLGSKSWMVTNSRDAFGWIREYLDANTDDRTLIITESP